jgi:hypothetical protein
MTMAEVPPGAITVADLYREIAGMRADVGRALERLAVVEIRNTTADATHMDHEGRLRTLERFRFTLMGVASAVGAISGIVAQVIHLH